MLSSKVLLGICTASIVTLCFCPESGLEIRVPKNVLKFVVGSALLYVAYRAFFSTSTTTTKSKFIYFSSREKMRAQVAKEYKTDKMEMTSEHPCPKVVHPNDVLVRVRAASINPIDQRIIAGHARPIFDKMRQQKQLPYGGAELPLVLGRDCSGVVEDIGRNVEKFRIGDEVFVGIGAEDSPGTFALKVLVKDYMVAKKPVAIDHTEAASIPYVCTTTWGALVGRCGLGPINTNGKRVLIIAGTGGIGTFAIQLIKAWGGHVTTTCCKDGIDLVERLGADDVIDYTKGNFEDALTERPKFDVIFVTLGAEFIKPCQSALKRGGKLVTIVVPFIGNFNKYGMMLGMVVNAALKLRWMVEDFLYDRKTMISFNQPNGGALEEVRKLIDDGMIHPVIHKTFAFEAANEAMEFVKRGHARGKTVIVMPNHDKNEG
ncbi:reticulon-4-interacting protein 1 homolog, mitochondrial [Strongylocentrotus purpuratus]|uniref:Enoyl reductase (ER) domain-containing protein n=1 Tax=Strongylocentrotus purpuratus TaxID=7668 RepID=A0A7M7NPZ0_STRPU|nr:reticulon-4-interacting protein 1 homolog, mitochondrial [Strongylocentrotus purpuratus]